MRPGGRVSRADLVAHLNAARIATRYLFGGNLIHQPYMKGRNFRVAGETPNADLVMRETFWIGVFPGLTPAHTAYMLEVFAGFFAGLG